MQTHMQPEFGFPENQAILSLMTEQPKTLYKSNEIEAMRSLLGETRIQLEKLEFDIEHADEKIKDHFIEQRRLIQLRAEETIDEVNQIAGELINEMNAYEKDCLNELEAKMEQNKSYLDQIVRPEVSHYHNEVNIYLESSQLSMEQVKKANEIVNKMKTNIQAECSNSCLWFDKRLIVFNPEKSHINESILGHIDFENSQPNVSILINNIFILDFNFYYI